MQCASGRPRTIVSPPRAVVRSPCTAYEQSTAHDCISTSRRPCIAYERSTAHNAHAMLRERSAAVLPLGAADRSVLCVECSSPQTIACERSAAHHRLERSAAPDCISTSGRPLTVCSARAVGRARLYLLHDRSSAHRVQRTSSQPLTIVCTPADDDSPRIAYKRSTAHNAHAMLREQSAAALPLGEIGRAHV